MAAGLLCEWPLGESEQFPFLTVGALRRGLISDDVADWAYQEFAKAVAAAFVLTERNRHVACFD
jgi:hypothetical protein